MRQEIIRLYDDYTHERVGRRAFMDRLAALAGGTAAASALLPRWRSAAPPSPAPAWPTAAGADITARVTATAAAASACSRASMPTATAG